MMTKLLGLLMLAINNIYEEADWTTPASAKLGYEELLPGCNIKQPVYAVHHERD
jgi:hypothetical protein